MSQTIKIITAAVITAIIVGGGVYFWKSSEMNASKQKSQQEITSVNESLLQLQDENKDLKDEYSILKNLTLETVESSTVAQETNQPIVLVDQIPLECLPSGEFAKIGFSDFIYETKTPPIELYLKCRDMNWLSDKHIYFAQPADLLKKRIKVLAYELTNDGLNWQFKNNEMQILSTKSDIPSEGYDSFGLYQPIKVFDLTLNGKELKLLDTPIEFDDGGLGGFQGATFELTSLSEGTLTLDERKFAINLANNTVKEVK